VIPSTLAENAGLNPIATVTELRNRHAQGDITAGINVRKVYKSVVSVSLPVNWSFKNIVLLNGIPPPMQKLVF
jgi:chaperonin GroEL (HSP60 family)